MRGTLTWLKKNKLTALLLVIIIFLAAKAFTPSIQPRLSQEDLGVGRAEKVGVGEIGLIPSPDYVPVETEDRLVVEESSLSLVVKDVREISNQIVDRAKAVGGFMVSTSMTRPEEAPFATVIIRVPAEKLREAIDHFRDLAIKVSSEKVIGTDVTAEYTDLQARLETLEKTKAKFESILNQATEIQDILQVQRELIYLQDQIDNLKGREEYLAQTAKLAKITVYLSTDEFALPYAPAEPFRPGVIFKQAVRSVVLALRKIVEALIWVGVYAVFWLPVVLLVLFLKKQKKSS